MAQMLAGSEVAEGNNVLQPLRAKKSREWCFTINNFTEDDKRQTDEIECRYICYAPEVGKNGTPHLQGYVVFHNQRYMKAVSKLLSRAYLTPARGSGKENKQYIQGPYTKGSKHKPLNNEFKERGELPEQGKRNDLQAFHEDIKAGKRGRDLSVDHLATRAKYPQLEKTLVAEEDYETAIQWFESGKCPEVHVRWGEPGTGKSKFVYDEHGARNIYELNLGDGCLKSVWWDGYQGQPIILINDFDGELGWKYLLRLLDRYPFRMQIKGGHCWRLATHIYITANKPPTDWYPAEKCTALMRRLKSVTEVR